MSKTRFRRLHLLALLGLYSISLLACTNSNDIQTKTTQEKHKANGFELAVETILLEKLSALEKAIHSKEILAAIEASNLATSSFSQEEIHELVGVSSAPQFDAEQFSEASRLTTCAIMQIDPSDEIAKAKPVTGKY